MSDYAGKNLKNRKQADIGGDDQSKLRGLAPFQFIDNRPQNILQGRMQSLANLSPRTQKVAQLATKITHVTEAFQTAREQFDLARSMDAVLDPEDPVQGSAVGSEDDENKLSLALKDKFRPGLHRAHLLHHDLGGFGVNANLYPMTALANRTHERTVESLVLDALHNKKHGVHYTVTVNPTGGRSVEGLKSKTSFDCEAYSHDIASGRDGNLIVKKSIESAPSADNPEPPTRDDGTEKPQAELLEEELATWGYGGFKSYTIPSKWRHYGRSVWNDSLYSGGNKWLGNVSATERKGSGRNAIDFNSREREIDGEVDNSDGKDNTLDDYVGSQKIAIAEFESGIDENHDDDFDRSAPSTKSSGFGELAVSEDDLSGTASNNSVKASSKKRKNVPASSSRSYRGRGIHAPFKSPVSTKVKEVEQEKIKEQKVQEKEEDSVDSSEESFERSKKKSKQVHQAESSEEESVQEELELLVASILSEKGYGWSGRIALSDESAEFRLDKAGIPKKYKNSLIDKVYELSGEK